MPDPYGRAIRDEYRGERDEPLLERYGDEALEHASVESLYFGEFSTDCDDAEWVASWLDGPLLDLGAGAGRHALYFQEQFETVAIEVSDYLVETMRDRGVADARRADMFALRDHFERDRSRSGLVIGTQMSLAGSIQGLRAFLGDVAHVTTSDATAVLDAYHPEWTAEFDVPGYRHDPTPGLAYGVQQFEYEGDLGKPLLFRLFGPDRLREATVGTGWDVRDIGRHPSDREDAVQYRAALEKG
jgi:hypothetical protein